MTEPMKKLANMLIVLAVVGVFAAAVLLYVAIWAHGQTQVRLTKTGILTLSLSAVSAGVCGLMGGFE